MCFVIRVGTGKTGAGGSTEQSERCRYTSVSYVEGERKHVPHSTSQESSLSLCCSALLLSGAMPRGVTDV